MREVSRRYEDPLSLVWLGAAAALGYDVTRSADVFASFDGKHTLIISSPEHFDADDSMAQMIFHELCHALVAGPEGRSKPDWGLENVDLRDEVQEHAVNRLQAFLAGSHGLRDFFATTTDFRLYYDALPEDPLAEGDDPAIPIARHAAHDADQEPWRSALRTALQKTRTLRDLLQDAALPNDSLWLPSP